MSKKDNKLDTITIAFLFALIIFAIVFLFVGAKLNNTEIIFLGIATATILLYILYKSY